MNKEFADKMIQDFQKKFFGYSLTKTANMDEAEELAARIVCEAYITLRRVDDIYNWEGYLYRIASNVYAHYVKERQANTAVDITEMEFCDRSDFVSDMIKKEEMDLLKREVAWLGKAHRNIVLLHYYHNKTVAQISEILELPSGTVKWHLSDARKTMKEGMKKMRTVGNLGLEPIQFHDTGHDGTPGSLGDTSYFLNTKLRQNIAYAAYFNPKTIEEIAEELGINPVYIEDEVHYLEEYGFLDLMPGQKYLTNIFISNIPADARQKCFEIDKEIAEEVCRDYIPELVESFRNFQEMALYVPDNDFNYLLWSLVPMAIRQIRIAQTNYDLLRHTHYQVKRKDGGDYIAFATIAQPETQDDSDNQQHYSICGDMTREAPNCCAASWSLSTDFDTREFGWMANQDADCEYLYLYLTGKLPKIESLLDKYVRLYARGLLAKNGDEDEINVIIARETPEENGKICEWNSWLRKSIPDISESLLTSIRQKFARKVQLLKKYYPQHMHKLVEHYNQIDVNRVVVIDTLLENGVLQPLSEKQKKGVMTVIYSDILPESDA